MPAMPTWHTGKLLVAMPVLDDPAFARAVVLLIDHDEDGALGIVLNRASEVPVSEATDALIDLIPAPGVLSLASGAGSQRAGAGALIVDGS
jgi:putative transcriptional regulator